MIKGMKKSLQNRVDTSAKPAMEDAEFKQMMNAIFMWEYLKVSNKDFNPQPFFGIYKNKDAQQDAVKTFSRFAYRGGGQFFGMPFHNPKPAAAKPKKKPVEEFEFE
jgi:hypothetical protein